MATVRSPGITTSVSNVPESVHTSTSESAPETGNVIASVPSGHPAAGTRLMLAVGGGGGGGGGAAGGVAPGGVPGETISVSAHAIRVSAATPAYIANRKLFFIVIKLALRSLKKTDWHRAFPVPLRVFSHGELTVLGRMHDI